MANEIVKGVIKLATAVIAIAFGTTVGNKAKEDFGKVKASGTSDSGNK